MDNKTREKYNIDVCPSERRPLWKPLLLLITIILIGVCSYHSLK